MYSTKNTQLRIIFFDDFKIFQITLTRFTKRISTISLMNNWIAFMFVLWTSMKLRKNCHWKKVILKNHKESRDIWLFWPDSMKWIEKFFINSRVERCNFWFAINNCLNIWTRMYLLNESSMKLKINKRFWNNCMMKMNIKIEKTFIDVWQTNIDDAIYTKIVKNMSLTVTFVSVKSLTERKKHCILYKCRHFSEKST